MVAVELHQRFGLKTSSAATSDRSSRGVAMANPGLIRIRSLVRPFGSRIKSIKCCVKEDDLGLEWLLLDIEMRSNLL